MTIAWIDTRAIDQMVSDIRRWGRRKETGGPLFGYESDSQVVIACAPSLGSYAERSPALFEPDSNRVDFLIAETWSASRGRYRYLGSWHSHPGGSALPSETDLVTLQSISLEKEVDFTSPILMIVATSRVPLRRHIQRLAVWRRHAEPLGMTMMEVVQTVLDERFCSDDVNV